MLRPLAGWVLGAWALVLVATGCAGEGTGVSVTGNGKIDLTTYGWTTISDKPGTKTVNCQPSTGQGGSVQMSAEIAEHDVGEGFKLQISFDSDSLDVDSVALTATLNAMTYEGDDCQATVKGYAVNGSEFSADVSCATSNGGAGPEIALDADWMFCQLVAPR